MFLSFPLQIQSDAKSLANDRDNFKLLYEQVSLFLSSFPCLLLFSFFSSFFYLYKVWGAPGTFSKNAGEIKGKETILYTSTI